MKRIFAALTIAAAAALVAATMASAHGVARYQIQTATLNVDVYAGGHDYWHYYDITINPCDGSFTGYALATGVNGGFEDIVGTLDQGAGTISYTATYTEGNLNTHVDVPGYHYTYDGPLSGGTAYDFNADNSARGSFPVTNTLTNVTDSTTYKNHGAYVSQNPDKNDAAHSCLGMPIKP